MSHLKYVLSLPTLKKVKKFRYTKAILMLIEGSRPWYSGVDLKVFRYMFANVSKEPAASGVPRGVWGFNPPSPRNSEGPPKSC